MLVGADQGRCSAPGRRKQDYVDLLAMLYQLFKLVQQSGVMALEAHFEDPAKSPILASYPKFLARHEAVDFLADSAKVIIVGGIARARPRGADGRGPRSRITTRR